MEDHHDHDLALIISDLAGGGAQRVVTTLANHWARQGYRIAVITLAESGTDYFTLDPQVDRLVSGGIGASKSAFLAATANFRRLRSIRRKLQEAGAPTAMAFVGATNVLTVLAAMRLGMRVVISERNDPARQSLGHAWDALRRLFYRFATLVTANSQSALRSLSAYVPDRKLALVRNPVLPPNPRPSPSPEPIIVCVARLVPHKGQEILLDAFSRMADLAPDWQLVIVGDGPDADKLKSRAHDLGIADRTEFTGRTDPWEYYARASIFALVSEYEGTSNALLEAMSMGVPPIISDTSGGNLELVKDGVSGLVTTQNDVSGLAEILRRLTSDEKLRQRLGNAASQRVSNFSLESVADEWAALLKLAPVSDGHLSTESRHQP